MTGQSPSEIFLPGANIKAMNLPEANQHVLEKIDFFHILHLFRVHEDSGFKGFHGETPNQIDLPVCTSNAPCILAAWQNQTPETNSNQCTDAFKH